MNKITLQELFANAKPKLVSEDIVWDGNVATVFFQRLTMAENADIGRPYLNDDGTGIAKDKIKNFQSELLATTVRDENGNKIVTPDDVLGWDGGFYQAVLKASEKHNPGGTPKEIEAIAKNSDPTPSTASS